MGNLINLANLKNIEKMKAHFTTLLVIALIASTQAVSSTNSNQGFLDYFMGDDGDCKEVCDGMDWCKDKCAGCKEDDGKCPDECMDCMPCHCCLHSDALECACAEECSDEWCMEGHCDGCVDE